MTIAVFDTELGRVEWLANLLNQDVELTFNEVLEIQHELSKVGYYND